MPFESLTLATFLRAELGFLGVTVFTEVQTPRFCGALASVGLRLSVFKPLSNAGAVDFFIELCLPSLTNWLIVGIFAYFSPFFPAPEGAVHIYISS
jgi:hypothetical protein